MVRVRFLFYSFFLVFNLAYLIYNISMGFDWSKALIPAILVVICGANIYSIHKQTKQSD